jgi:hypothetical protein
MKTTWRSRLPMSKKKLSGRPTGYEEKTSRLKNASEQDSAKKRLQGKPDCEQRQRTDI